MRVTGATIRRKRRRLRELAAFWCAVLASDRATNAWSIKLLRPEIGAPAIRLAWQAYNASFTEPYQTAELWLPAGVSLSDCGPIDTAAERWARAEAWLRTGWRPRP